MTPSGGSGSTAYRTYTCPDCKGGKIEQNKDGSEFCLDCGWTNIHKISIRNYQFKNKRKSGRGQATGSGAHALFSGEGSLTSDGLNSLQRAEIDEKPKLNSKHVGAMGKLTAKSTIKFAGKTLPQTFQGTEKQATSAFCEKCGATLKLTTKFCGKCGTPRT